MCRRFTLRRPEQKGQLRTDAPQRSLSSHNRQTTRKTQGIGVQVHIRTVSTS